MIIPCDPTLISLTSLVSLIGDKTEISISRFDQLSYRATMKRSYFFFLYLSIILIIIAFVDHWYCLKLSLNSIKIFFQGVLRGCFIIIFF
jgi:hypothetical protein